MAPRKFSLAAASLIVAALLWVLIFLVRPLNFWVMLSFSTFVLLVLAFLINRNKFSFQVSGRALILGLVSGLLLYAFFYLGFQATKWSPIFSEGVSRVYDLRSSAPGPLIGLALIFPIAPGEEIYWRGLIQNAFVEKVGPTAGLVLAAFAYASVHLPTLNTPLILTALIGGIVWGYVYKITNRLLAVVVSHVIFDLLIFVIAPLG